jgi:site-specific DNA-methyltransferase (adenine-specific)
VTDRLYRGDCLEILPTLPSRSVQLIATSPPYNVGYDYADGGASDRLPLAKYLGLLRAFLGLAHHVLGEGGVLALNLPPTIRTDEHRAYPLAAWAQVEMQAQGYLLSEPVAWVKSAGGEPVAQTTAFGAPTNPYLRPTYEQVLIGHRGTFKVPGKTAAWFDGFLEVVKDTWMLPAGRRKKGQALAFPAELVSNLVNLYSCLGDVVLDPFAGTGTAGKVARQMGRVAWLVERQPAYWDALEAVVRQAHSGILQGVPG